MPEIMTVRGPISSDEMGMTLPHEHVFCNILRENRETGLLNDEELMIEEISVFRQHGGRTLWDVSSYELTVGSVAEPASSTMESLVAGTRGKAGLEAVQRVAAATGVNIVVGTGHYRDPYLDRLWFDMASADSIADRMEADISQGFPGSTVRAGVIGEIGADKWYISAAEERSFRGAARAHGRTGATITTHAARWPVGLAQLDLLESEGASPGHVIIGHCDTVNDPAYHAELARRGAYVQFDTIRRNSRGTEQRISFVKNMIQQGYLERILLSHDVCLTSHLQAGGGGGYGWILTDFVPRLRAALNLGDEEIDTIMVQNPRRALTGEVS
jgi:predicted metal-dependent phosphotriesterase family hydrolase